MNYYIIIHLFTARTNTIHPPSCLFILLLPQPTADKSASHIVYESEQSVSRGTGGWNNNLDTLIGIVVLIYIITPDIPSGPRRNDADD